MCFPFKEQSMEKARWQEESNLIVERVFQQGDQGQHLHWQALEIVHALGLMDENGALSLWSSPQIHNSI